MPRPAPFRRLAADRRGATVVEFALLAAPLLTLLLGTVELGYLAYSRTIVEGAIKQASRMASTGQYDGEEIEAQIRNQLARIRATGDDVTIVTRAYGSFEDVHRPEPLTSDVEPLGGTPGSGDCYIDLNGDEQWSEDASQEGLGASEDIIYFEVQARYQPLFKFIGHVIGGADERLTLKANTTIKNEPFGEEREPAEARCIP